VEANGISINFEEEGTGQPLLLIMGLGGQLIDWPQSVVGALVEAGFRVIRHDNRDSGLSQGFDWVPPSQVRLAAAHVSKRLPEVGYRVDDMAADAAGLLDAIGLESAHIVGASMGGMIAQSMAINHPERVLSLCSIMSNTGDKRSGGVAPKVLTKLARAKTPPREVAPEYATKLYSYFAGSAWDPDQHLIAAARAVERAWRPEGTARQAAAISASPDRTAALADVTAPTLVVHGLQDRLIVPSGGIATARAIPGSRLVMYPEMGHDLPAARVGELVAEIRTNAERATVGSLA